MNAEELLLEYYVNRSRSRSPERLQILKSKHAICESEIELHKFRIAKGDSDKLQERLKINNEVMTSLELAEQLMTDVDSLIFLNKALLKRIKSLDAEKELLEQQINFNK